MSKEPATPETSADAAASPHGSTAPERSAAPDPAALPPDPEAYDSPRAVQARARGLQAPYIPGGEDPNPEATGRQERRYRILLVAMIVAVVLLGFVLGILQNIIGF